MRKAQSGCLTPVAGTAMIHEVSTTLTITDTPELRPTGKMEDNALNNLERYWVERLKRMPKIAGT